MSTASVFSRSIINNSTKTRNVFGFFSPLFFVLICESLSNFVDYDWSTYMNEKYYYILWFLNTIIRRLSIYDSKIPQNRIGVSLQLRNTAQTKSSLWLFDMNFVRSNFYLALFHLFLSSTLLTTPNERSSMRPLRQKARFHFVELQYEIALDYLIETSSVNFLMAPDLFVLWLCNKNNQCLYMSLIGGANISFFSIHSIMNSTFKMKIKKSNTLLSQKYTDSL